MKAHGTRPALRALGLSASPGGERSRSRQLLELAAADFAARGVDVTIVDLAQLDPTALLGRALHPGVRAAVEAVADADIVVAATPIYRATYSGLLKVFFDLLPNGALAEKVAVPIASGGSPGHQLAIDHGLRPLFSSLGATVIPTGIYASPETFADGGPERALRERIERAVNESLAIASLPAAVSPSTLTLIAR